MVEWKGDGMLPFETGGSVFTTEQPDYHQQCARARRIKAVAVIAFNTSLPPA